MEVASKTKIIEYLSKILKPIIKKIFPNLIVGSKSYNNIIMNVIANILGLGNAATPLGLKAMAELQKENRNKVLSLINSDEKLITNYYAIPTNVWDMILQDYTTKFKSGIRKPQLAHINIDVRLYNEEEEIHESEMQKLAHEFFGDNVNFI